MQRRKFWYCVRIWNVKSNKSFGYSDKFKKWMINPGTPYSNWHYPIFRYTNAIESANQLACLLEQHNVSGEVMVTRFFTKNGERWVKELFSYEISKDNKKTHINQD